MRGDGVSKLCPMCGIDKPLTEYGAHKRDGIRSRCKACVRDAKRIAKMCRRCGEMKSPDLFVLEQSKMTVRLSCACTPCRLQLAEESRVASAVRGRRTNERHKAVRRAAEKKLCPQCLKSKGPAAFGIHAVSGLMLSRCRACIQANKKARARAAGKVIWERNREAIIEKFKRYIRPESSRERSRKHRSELSEGYVRALLGQNSCVAPSEFPQALVDAKREYLRIKRALKGNNHEERKL